MKPIRPGGRSQPLMSLPKLSVWPHRLLTSRLMTSPTSVPPPRWQVWWFLKTASRCGRHTNASASSRWRAPTIMHRCRRLLGAVWQNTRRKRIPERAFGRLPDLILLDGGQGHLNAVQPILRAFGLDIPMYGMVKDDRHRTRAIASDGGEISIAAHKRAFQLVTAIQDEVHRYSITYSRSAHRKKRPRVDAEWNPWYRKDTGGGTIPAF